MSAPPRSAKARVAAGSGGDTRQQASPKSTAQPGAFQLRETPERSDRQIAAALGVDHKTVGAVRTDMHATGEIPQLTHTEGADGKTRPRANGKAAVKGEPTWARSLRALYGPPKVPFPRRRT
jgi:hypothetical protein